jgi:DHA2 family multidrug resistance protein
MNTAATTSTEWQPKHNRWVIAVVVSLAAFMEVLDTSVANVALPHIAGNLGATVDESTWVLTSYLVSNAIVLPLGGWLVATFGRRRFFMACIVAFTLSSLLCGIAPNLGVLIIARILQGAGGGGLQPMAQAVLADTFPPRQRGIAFSIYSITALLAPSIGPTLGGWITDNYSWRWIFNINLPVGIITLALVYYLLEDPPYMMDSRTSRGRIDYIGFSLLTLGVGALQILLDRGQEDDWFASRFMIVLAATAAISLTFLVVHEWRQKDPIIDVSLFRNSNFTIAALMMFIGGSLAFSSTVLIPRFLQTLLGYTAKNAGMVMSVANLPLLVLMPVIAKSTMRFQARYIAAFGWISLAGGLYFSALHTNLFTDFATAACMRVAQYLPVLIQFVPVSMAAYFGIAKEKNNSVAALINFMRNIGQGVGTALVTTVIARRMQLHQATLVPCITPANRAFRAAHNGLIVNLKQAGVSVSEAPKQALARLYALVQAQAAVLAYIDTYWILALGATGMFLLSFLLKGNHSRSGSQSQSRVVK